MAPLETAVHDLRALLLDDIAAPGWRWDVRRRLSALREALSDPGRDDSWPCPRQGISVRQRRQLQARVTALAAGVLDRFDLEHVQRELRRLACDLDRHVQRVHDLAYDSVALELGGSE